MTGAGKSVLACLVHEAPDCVGDLVANLRCLDPEAVILLYDGGTADVCRGFHRPEDGVHVHPAPHPIGWGRLHDYALDCLRYGLGDLGMAAMTMLDSDQIQVRPGYSPTVLAWLADRPDAGVLVTAPQVQPPETMIGPAQAAWREIDRWRPFLRRFPGGEQQFPHWTFWPGTVFTEAAARDVVELWEDAELQALIAGTEMWATEEVVLPTLVALAGHEVAKTPFSYDLIRYRSELSPEQLEVAFEEPDVFWAHPVARRYDDPIRARIRQRYGYQPVPPVPPAATPDTGAPADRAGGERRAHTQGHPRRVQVSCVLPVTGGPRQVAQAVRYFLRQDCGDTELVVVDDGAESVAGLLPADSRIRVIRLDGPQQVGQKRNIGCAQAWGEIIVNWDDRSWMAGWRVAHQVEALRRNSLDVCGLRRFRVVRPPDGPAWRYEHPDGPAPWVAGTSACFRRRLWEQRPFEGTGEGLDEAYLAAVAPERILALPDSSFFVAMVDDGELHGGEEGWHAHPLEEVRALLGADWEFYAGTATAAGRSSMPGHR